MRDMRINVKGSVTITTVPADQVPPGPSTLQLLESLTDGSGRAIILGGNAKRDR